MTAKITGLTAGTGYRFRVGATNNAGTTESAAKAFATLADTCTTNPALCPPPPTKPTPTPSAPAIIPPLAQPPAAPPVTKPLKCRKGFKKKKVRSKAKCVKVKKNRRGSG